MKNKTLMGIPLNNEVQPRQLALHLRTGTALPPVMGTSTTLLLLFLELHPDCCPEPVEPQVSANYWGRYQLFTPPASSDAESSSDPCYKMQEQLTNDTAFRAILHTRRLPTLRKTHTLRGIGIYALSNVFALSKRSVFEFWMNLK